MTSTHHSKSTKSQSKQQASPDLQTQLAKTEARLKRALADYYNLEQRIKREKELIVKFANESLLLKLLALKDDLERAAQALPDSGLDLILKNFQNLLASEQVKEIPAHHHPFDPHTMEAVERVAGPANQVVAVLQKGYYLHDKVLRPAKVKVGVGQKQSRYKNKQATKQ